MKPHEKKSSRDLRNPRPLTEDEINEIGCEATSDDPVEVMQMFENLMSGKIRDDARGLIFESLIDNPFLPFDKAEQLATHWFSLPCPASDDPDDEDSDRHAEAVFSIPYTLCHRKDATEQALARWLKMIAFDDLADFSYHPNLGHGTLDHLVRALAAASTKDRRTLKALVSDPKGLVRFEAMSNRLLNASIIADAALTDHDYQVVMAATHKIKDPDILSQVAARIWENPSEELAVMEALLQNPRTPQNSRTKLLSARARIEASKNGTGIA